MWIWDFIVWFGLAAAIWISGEAGRIAVAGGAGAIVRWWASEQRSLRNGVVQTVSGALVATYMWPLVFGVLNYFLPIIEKDPQTIAACAFVAGMMGISVAKIFLALMENFASQHRNNGGPDRGE
jgi:hypothetical protein